MGRDEDKTRAARSDGRMRWLCGAVALVAAVACGEEDGLVPPELSCEPDCEVRPEIPPGTGMWELGPPMPEQRMRHAATVFQGDLVVAGGIVGPATFTESVIRLRPGADAWEPMADLPYQLAGNSLVVVADTLFVVGGDGPFYGRPERALYAYDPDADEWLRRTPIPDWRVMTEPVELDGLLWLTGGPVVRTTDHGPLVPGDTTLLYEPGGDEWSYSRVLPTPRWDHEAVPTPEGLTYLVGGEDGRFPRVFPDVEFYDAVADEWSSVPDPFATNRVAAAYVEPFVHVVGGQDVQSIHRALDTRNGEWVAHPSLPAPLDWSKLVLWQDALWLIGGSTPQEGAPQLLHDEVWYMEVDDIGQAR